MIQTHSSNRMIPQFCLTSPYLAVKPITFVTFHPLGLVLLSTVLKLTNPFSMVRGLQWKNAPTVAFLCDITP
jgi:hypothetical protein